MAYSVSKACAALRDDLAARGIRVTLEAGDRFTFDPGRLTAEEIAFVQFHRSAFRDTVRARDEAAEAARYLDDASLARPVGGLFDAMAPCSDPTADVIGEGAAPLSFMDVMGIPRASYMPHPGDVRMAGAQDVFGSPSEVIDGARVFRSGLFRRREDVADTAPAFARRARGPAWMFDDD